MGDLKIAILTDSSAYIPESLMEGLNIHVIPVWLIWDDEPLRDGVDIKPDTFYERLKRSKTLPTTSQPSTKEFEAFFLKLKESYDAIVAPLVSSRMSGTLDCAQAAAKEIPDFPIHLIDTYGGSMAHGFVVLAAARAAAEGLPIHDVVAAAEKMRAKVHLLFAVDTLEYLHRGGRLSGAKRYFGTALQIKPILQFIDGTIAPLSQARTRRKALEVMLDLVEERIQGRSMAEACVVNVDCRADGESMVEVVKQRFNPQQVHLADVSPVVGTLVGPGGLGLAYYPEE